MKKNRLCPSLISLLFLAALTSAPAQDRAIRVRLKPSTQETIEKLYTGSYALVVGNGDYTAGLDPLPGAVSDAKEVAEALRRKGFNVTLKTNLTGKQFSEAFAQFVHNQGSKPGHQVLFYYAGHGHTKKMANGEELGYLAMVDAPDPNTDPIGFQTKSMNMVQVVTQAKLLKAKHALFMFDSCFSGTVLNLRGQPKSRAIADSVRYPVRQFITAGRANEPVPDYSRFKQCFLDILEGRAPEPIPDGYLTGEELGLYLKNKVPEYLSTQHPQFGKIKDPKLDKGDFIFQLENIEGGKITETASPSIASPPAPAPKITPTPIVSNKVEKNIPDLTIVVEDDGTCKLSVSTGPIAPSVKLYRIKKSLVSRAATGLSSHLKNLGYKNADREELFQLINSTPLAESPESTQNAQGETVKILHYVLQVSKFR